MTKQEMIDFFEKQKKEQTNWYMGRERVSIAMMIDQDNFVKKCDWAIKMIKDTKDVK